MSHLAWFVLKQATIALGVGGTWTAQEGYQNTCDSYEYEQVSVGRRTESRPYRVVDATTPYWIPRHSDCKQPCTGDYWMFKTVGRRQVKVTVRDVEVIPKSIPQETGCATKHDGDYWAYRSVGRRQARVWMHDEPIDAGLARSEGVNPCCRDCSDRSDAVDEHLERRGFCMVDGRRANCSTNPPECPDCASRMKPTIDEVLP